MTGPGRRRAGRVIVAMQHYDGTVTAFAGIGTFDHTVRIGHFPETRVDWLRVQGFLRVPSWDDVSEEPTEPPALEATTKEIEA